MGLVYLGGIDDVSCLNIQLMDEMRVSNQDRQAAVFTTRNSRKLLAYMAFYIGRELPRGSLPAVFWPAMPAGRARRALNTELWRLRNTLRSLGCLPDALIESTSDIIKLRLDGPLRLDVVEFFRATDPIIDTSPDTCDNALITSITGALACHRGNLLPCIYDDWALLPREEVRARQLAALQFLLEAQLARKAWADALATAHRLLKRDELMEAAHRAAMRAHHELGNQACVVRQYAQCAQALQRELDIAPMAQTTRLYEALQRAGAAQGGERRELAQAPTERTEHRIELAIASLDRARRTLREADRCLRRESATLVPIAKQ